ncbi:prepilin-type N-terminal cleavage/methylation domain-containing protein [Nesterenkonia sandarakina]|uniref:Prepilin-type N-terminal cleavage/methylation domain-containing protein n=1 Tax=Nesterenkonia sandarakina TaxID=272918 RepID=A0A2T0YSC7_9MICC|nr:prepilin-type N-terminal cleavage/methylation domain-containing protein [Nesterenkonia sandarakina]PRZ18696.1 prepilin-type N-terminal cleavage/methylation domain-containing protein [Nesterenkonia sandarakina]
MKERNVTTDTGFTLIELIVVVIIIAVIAAIAVPLYNGFQTQAKQAAVDSTARTVLQEFTLNDEPDDIYYRSQAMNELRRKHQDFWFEWADRYADTSCLRVMWNDDREIYKDVGSQCPGENVKLLTCSKRANGNVFVSWTAPAGSTLSLRVGYTGLTTGNVMKRDHLFSNKNIADSTDFATATLTTADGETLEPVRLKCS